ncbi:hypothetical protein DFJ73DRAFT_946759 [Zopfochytrium polystomum]|nr:hypothetical protein DFJ73DRAFT_946759 [Zopfochytrium polystomum]
MWSFLQAPVIRRDANNVPLSSGTTLPDHFITTMHEVGGIAANGPVTKHGIQHLVLEHHDLERACHPPQTASSAPPASPQGARSSTATMHLHARLILKRQVERASKTPPSAAASSRPISDYFAPSSFPALSPDLPPTTSDPQPLLNDPPSASIDRPDDPPLTPVGGRRCKRKVPLPATLNFRPTTAEEFYMLEAQVFQTAQTTLKCSCGQPYNSDAVKATSRSMGSADSALISPLLANPQLPTAPTSTGSERLRDLLLARPPYLTKAILQPKRGIFDAFLRILPSAHYSVPKFLDELLVDVQGTINPLLRNMQAIIADQDNLIKQLVSAIETPRPQLVDRSTSPQKPTTRNKATSTSPAPPTISTSTSPLPPVPVTDTASSPLPRSPLPSPLRPCRRPLIPGPPPPACLPPPGELRTHPSGRAKGVPVAVGEDWEGPPICSSSTQSGPQGAGLLSTHSAPLHWLRFALHHLGAPYATDISPIGHGLRLFEAWVAEDKYEAFCDFLQSHPSFSLLPDFDPLQPPAHDHHPDAVKRAEFAFFMRRAQSARFAIHPDLCRSIVDSIPSSLADLFSSRLVRRR